MWNAIWTAVSAVLFVCCPAGAPIHTGFPGAPGLTADCVGAGYEIYSFETQAAIPDGDPAGVVIGPLKIPDDGSVLQGIMLAVNLSHDYTGDVDLRLEYDEDNDGTCELSIPVELYRARADGCTAREPFAYPDVLDGTYYFRDEAACAGLPADPMAGDGVRSFSDCDGLKRGGSFYLVAADRLPGETGAVWGWTVFVKTGLSAVAQVDAAGGERLPVRW
jgi:hypothetical protein